MLCNIRSLTCGFDFPALPDCLLRGLGKLLWPESVIRKRGTGGRDRKFIAYTAAVLRAVGDFWGRREGSTQPWPL